MLAMVKLLTAFVCAGFLLVCSLVPVSAQNSADGSHPEVDRPYTIAVYGDSLGDGIWSGLYQLLHNRTDVILLRRSAVGARLTRSDFTDWMAEVNKQLDAQPIDAAIIMFGANDQTGLRDDTKKGYVFETDGWRAAYAERVGRILTDLRDRHVKAVWVGLPILRNPDLNVGAQYLNTLFQSVVSENQATFVPLASDFLDEKGSFSLYRVDGANRSRQIRLEDGTHFTGYGYELIARKVLAVLPIHQPVVASSGDGKP